MKQGTDLIWLSLDRVENKYSSTSFAMAKELSKRGRVFFVNNPMTWSEAFRIHRNDNREKIVLEEKHGIYGRVKGLPENFVSVTPPVMLPINWMERGSLYNWGSRFNNTLFNRTIGRIIRDNNIREYVFVNLFNPFYGSTLQPTIKPALKVYYSVDDIRHSPYVKKHGPWLEEEMVKQYDITLTTSRHLQHLLQEHSSNVYYLPNAADTALFKTSLTDSFEKPEDIRHIDTPIIMYTGHVDWRVNIELLTAIADQHQDKTLVFVGPVSLKTDDLDLIRRFPNVIFTGAKKLEQLPAYLHYARCAIIPFKCNTLTKSIYPLKINEYLSAGLPVVATNFSEDVSQFSEVVFLEDEVQSYVSAIGSAIATDSDSQRKARVSAAENNNWSARAVEFWRLLSQPKK